MLPKNYVLLVFFMHSLITSSLNAQLKLIINVNLVDKHFDLRKRQAIEVLSALAAVGFKDPYIAAMHANTASTFIDNYCNKVFYYICEEKNATNELKELYETSNYFNFDPEDLIIKIDGEFYLLSPNFLQLIQNNSHYDMFVKKNGNGALSSACFVMRYKYLKEMISQFEDTTPPSIEYVLQKYISRKIENNQNFKIWFIDNLDLQGNVYGIPITS